MCGIAGFKARHSFHAIKESLGAALQTLSHRGPDDSGVFLDKAKGVGLGHRRLSVIDLSSAGRQPMSSDDGQVQIVYNGEIYNFKKIRTQLEAKGYRFRSNTDTEVVLKSYLQWGIDALKQFVGMFAFAIWDGRYDRFVLARDRLGIKPLYYYIDSDLFLFASELKALMAFECFSRDVDPKAVSLFLHYQYVPSPNTIFKKTYKLLPGHYLIYENNILKNETFWLKSDELVGLSHDETFSEKKVLERLDHLLTTAVEDRLVSDVPLGALLSGGIDSSLVVALMQKVSTEPVRTFSIGFHEDGYNEAPFAARIARHLGTKHTELYLDCKDALQVIPQIAEIYDEPFADSSALPTFLVSKMARSEVTVALSGDGGDEQFGGYARYWATLFVANRLHGFQGRIGKLLSKLLKRVHSQVVENFYHGCVWALPRKYRLANFQDKWRKMLDILGHTEVSQIYRTCVCIWPQHDLIQLLGRDFQDTLFEEILEQTESMPLLSRLMALDLKTYLPDALLTKVDRASMAVSLEVRVPLLDHRFVEYTLALPESFKVKNGTGKYALKKLLSRYVPLEYFQRAKMGFGIPLHKWLRAELKDLITDYLSQERLRKEGLFDAKVVDRKITEHLSGRADCHHQLWALLVWEMWRERWLSQH